MAAEIEGAVFFARGGMFDLVLIGQDEDDRSALHLLRALKREASRTAVVIMTEHGTIESAVEAIRLGAKEYLAKPRESDEVVAVVEKALMIGGPVDHAEWSPVHPHEASLVREGETIQSLQVMERAHILSTLDRVGWNRKRAAELLQISTTTLWRRLKEFGVESERNRRMLPPPPPRN